MSNQFVAVHYNRSRHRDRVVRRGIGMTIESDVSTTPLLPFIPLLLEARAHTPRLSVYSSTPPIRAASTSGAPLRIPDMPYHHLTATKPQHKLTRRLVRLLCAQ
jgi:hypothetical protein